MKLDAAYLDRALAPIIGWAESRSDVLGLALVGSWARDAARPDSDIDLVFLVSDPQSFREVAWLAEIPWFSGRVPEWHDANYGKAWSRHLRTEPYCEVECTFCHPSWAATNPIDPGTADVMSQGCQERLDNPAT